MGFGNGLGLRRLAKTALASALHGTGTDKLIGRLYGSRSVPLIIYYHRVVEDIAAHAGTSIPAMLISRRTLEQHLDWLGRHFNFVSLDELGSRLEMGEGSGKPVVAITFDDGYRDFYDNAFPLLMRKGIPAAVFVVTGIIGTSSVPFYDRLYLLLLRAFSKWETAERLAQWLDRLGIQNPEILGKARLTKGPFSAMRLLMDALPQDDIDRVIMAVEQEIEIEEESLDGLRPLGWAMLSKMHRSGITVGSHSQTHTQLINQCFQRVLDETMDSRQELERRLGIQVRHFAYPCGYFNSLVLSAVAASGYRFGYTTCGHRDPVYPLLTLPRKGLWENSCLDLIGNFSSAVISCQMNRVFDWLNSCNQDHGRPWPLAYASADSYPEPPRVG